MELSAALTLIQMDYVEMPGLRLTPEQGRRLWTLPLDICQAALDTLVASGFLARTRDGQYLHRGAAPVRIEMIDSLTWTAQRDGPDNPISRLSCFGTRRWLNSAQSGAFNPVNLRNPLTFE